MHNGNGYEILSRNRRLVPADQGVYRRIGEKYSTGISGSCVRAPHGPTCPTGTASKHLPSAFPGMDPFGDVCEDSGGLGRRLTRPGRHAALIDLHSKQATVGAQERGLQVHASQQGTLKTLLNFRPSVILCY